jgi:2,3-dihydroxybenzoate decarboxylase
MKNMKKIALEEHFSTPALSAYAHGAGSSMDRAGFARFEERLLEIGAQRIEAMDAAGIELAVLSVTTPGVQREPDTELAIERSHEANDYLAAQIRRYPHRFAGFAHLPLQDPAAAADELSRCVRELGFRGAMVNGHTNGHYLDERRFDPFWERVQSLAVPLYLHPRDPYDMPHMYRSHPELLGATWSWTVEAATHALRLVFGGTFERFPGVTLILGHMGETLPYLLWRLDSRSRIPGAGRPGGVAAPSEIIRRNIVVTTTGVCAHASLLCALAALGEDRVLFSVDYPYEDCRVACEFVESAPISAAQLRKVCYENAERILGLKLQSGRAAA